MSAAEAAKVTPMKQDNAGIQITGRIHDLKKYGESTYEHVIVVPNEDPYGHPNYLPIKDDHPHGKKGDDVTLRFRVRGRSYQTAKGERRFGVELWAV
jgi:hypothetical protein